MVPFNKIKLEAPLAEAFRSVGESGIAQVVSFGALAGLTTVTLILMLGQSRVFFAMSRDHLLPPLFSRVSSRFKTPYRTTILTGIAVAAMAFFVELKTLAELVNIGTLFAFMLVAIGVVVLRRTRPDLPRAYRTPAVPLVPILAVLASLWLMLNLPLQTWERFGIWMLAGLVVYFTYGRRHSRLAAR
jgi:APA family basic amino acid/polyamine antiporter